MKVLIIAQNEPVGNWLAAHLGNNNHEAILATTITDAKIKLETVKAIGAVISTIDINKPVCLDHANVYSIDIDKRGIRGLIIEWLNELTDTARVSR